MTSTLYKHSISFNIVTTDIDHQRIKDKPIRIKALLRFNNMPPMTFSGVARIVLGKYKLKEVKVIKDNTISTKIIPQSDAWDFEKQFPKNTVSNSKISRSLTDIKNKISDMFLLYCSELGRFPDKDEVKVLHANINAVLKNKPVNDTDPVQKSKTGNLLEYMVGYIKDSISSPPKRLMKGKPYKKRSVQSFLNTLNILSEFKGGQLLTFKDIVDSDVVLRIPVLRFEDINMAFYQLFRNYLGERGLGISYFGSQIKYIKKFMNESMVEGYHQAVGWKDKRFVKQTASADNEALTVEQLISLGSYDFNDRPVYDNARDLFLVGCWTGLRYSDYSRLTRDHIDSDFIDIHTRKTNEQVTIPILKELKRILKKYENTDTGFPRVISDVKLNRYIKEICRIVGENSDVSFLRTKPVSFAKISGCETKEMPLYERISTHTGRRSFATNAIRLQIPKSSIMKITGHKTEAAFDAYVKIKSRENASILASHFSKVDL